MSIRVAVLTLSLALPNPAWAAPTEEPPLQRPAAMSAPGEAPEAAEQAEAARVEAARAVAAAATTAAEPAPVLRTARAAGAEAGVYEVQAGAPAPATDGAPRYFRAPFAESMWPGLMGHEVLMVLGSGARECVTLTRKTPEALFFTHRKHGKQQAPLSVVTSLHEHSWECKSHEGTPSEWARSGAAAGLVLSGVGALMGVLYDASHPNPRCELAEVEGVDCGKGPVPHFMYSVLGISTVTLGTPVVAIGGASTSRDLRVRGKIWARAAGWTLYSAATVLNVLWLAGFYGRVEVLQRQGLTAGAGVLGLGGSGFMAIDALLARQELIALRRQDAQMRTGAGRGLRLGAAPIGQGGQLSGLSVGIGGRF